MMKNTSRCTATAATFYGLQSMKERILTTFLGRLSVMVKSTVGTGLGTTRSPIHSSTSFHSAL